MVIPERPTRDCEGNMRDDLIRHYSNEGYYILQNETGEPFTEAVDVYPCRYTYSETDEKIPKESPEEIHK